WIFNKYPNLRIDNNSPAFYIILRGIIGTLRIKQNFRDITFTAEANLLVPIPPQGSTGTEETTYELNEDLKFEISNLLEILKPRCKSNLEILPKYISDTFTLQDLSEVLADRSIIHKNRTFFESLNNEYA